MILAHVYILEHKSLRNINIKINGSFNCHVDGSDISMCYIEDTSGYYRGHHCSAIIGPNGVGKSSIIEFIELLVDDSDSSGVLIFFDQYKRIFIVVPINYAELSRDHVQNNCDFTIVTKRKSFLSDFKVNLVKLNNIVRHDVSLRRNKIHDRIIDLTVQHATSTFLQRKSYFNKLLSYFSDSHIQDYYTENVYFEFVFNSSPKSIADDVITTASMDSIYVDKIKKWKDYHNKRSLGSLNNIDSVGSLFQKLLSLNALSLMKSLTNDEDGNEILSGLIYRYANLDLNNISSNNTRIKLDLIFSDSARFNVSPEIKSLLQTKGVIKKENEWNVFLADKSIKVKLENHLNTIERISNIIYDYYQDFSEIKDSNLKIDDYSTVIELIDEINLLPVEMADNFLWGWRGISSGEAARTHILSESYHYLKNNNDKSHCIFLMDEIDLYLHPEWQRTFLNEFLEHLLVFESIYENPASQIVISTHSPIMVSDFLPDDIIALHKPNAEYGQGKIEVTDSVGFGNTISDIYMLGMHLKSVFGEHSRLKIEELMKSLEKGTLSSSQRALVQKIKNDTIKRFFLYHDKN